jgi:HEAT repeat protein
MLLQASAALAAPRPGRAAVTAPYPADMHISAGDYWWYDTWLALDSPASIRESVALWADLFGTRRVYWRGQQEEMVLEDFLVRPENLIYAHGYQWIRRLIYERRVNRVLIEEAHRRGMEVWAWAPLFDFGGPADTGGYMEFPYAFQWKQTLARPEWMPVDRHGVRRQCGPVAFCYPEARRAVIELYLRHLRRDGYDGIAFFTYAENYGIRFEDEYGFNEPAVEEFRRRHQVDVRKEPFDRHLWRMFLGEYVTAFLRELRAELATHRLKLGMCLNAREPNFPQPWNVSTYRLTAGRVYLDWEGWVREGLLDDLQVWTPRAPWELTRRTLENCRHTLRGSHASFTILVNQHRQDIKPYLETGARAVAAYGPEEAFLQVGYPEQAEAALEGPDAYAAMRVLAQIVNGKTKVPVERVLPLLKHERVLMRRLALKALAALKDPRAVPAVEAAFADPESSVHHAAARTLVALSGENAARVCLDAVRRYDDFQLFEAMAIELGAVPASRIPEVIAALADREERVRRLAAYTLARRAEATPPPGVREALIRALNDPAPFVRFRGAEGLGAFRDDPRVIDPLLKALRDSHVAVQARAATSLALAAGPAAIIESQKVFYAVLRLLKVPQEDREAALNADQRRVLAALAERFQEFKTGYRREDADWGFRSAGNAMLAFGAEGARRLETLRKHEDRLLAERAWQVLYLRLPVMDFPKVDDEETHDARAFAQRPA